MNDCGDNSDELQCRECLAVAWWGNLPGIASLALTPGSVVLSLPECATGNIKCSNGKCIPESQKCNGKDDCGDGSDEGKCDSGKRKETLSGCRGQAAQEGASPSQLGGVCAQLGPSA